MTGNRDPGIPVGMRVVAAQFDAYRILMEAVARDLEDAGISASSTREAAENYRRGAQDVREGKY